ncbi:hypothetical protein CCR75_001093 [Bremia lactucae]|uniref:Uncharacterized protein n=1 Tax=Bremia lactucae TaxID=4779 RepID=A0A976FS14_BRELC|nr:hypothetical protein CCR75_001093 [Bremia lactucae]
MGLVLLYSFSDAQADQEPKARTFISFWSRFNWNDNPWALATQDKPLKHTQFARVPPYQIQNLNIQRTGPRDFAFTIPSLCEDPPRHL